MNDYLTSLSIAPVEAPANYFLRLGEDSENIQIAIKLLETIAAGEIIEHFPSQFASPTPGDYSFSIIKTSLHMALNELGYYARVTKEVAENLRKTLPAHAVILDPLAGKGYAAKALREAGIPTIVSDDRSWGIHNEAIEDLDAVESLRKYGNEITHLLIAWAPYESDIDYKLLELCRKQFPHVTIINIGEGYGGCTGSEKFAKEVELIECPKIGYKNMYSIHDYVSFVH